ncbi:MAG: TonB-dependent receptor [Pseudomonadota bacterium]
MSRRPRACLPALGVTLSAVLLTQAPAQGQTADPALSDETSKLRNRTESVQWLPASITVIDAEELANTWRDDLEDLEGDSPGLLIDAMGASPRGAAISIRGAGSGEASNAMFPAVAVNLDGVYLGTHASQNQVLFDFESVEVARGPQGTFGGPPAMAGAINLTRTRPTGKLSAKTRLVTGDFNRKRVDAVINLPLGDRLAGKMSFNWQRGGSRVMNNATNLRKENEDHLNAVTLSLLWQDGGGTSVQYTLDRIDDKSDVPALLNLSDLNDIVCAASAAEANCSQGADGLRPETNSLDYTTQNYTNLREYEVDQHTLRAEFDLWGHHFRSITALRQSDEISNRDMDATFVDFYSVSQSREYTQLTQEFSLFREYNDQVDYTLGVYLLGNESALQRSDAYVLSAISSNNPFGPSIVPVPAGTTRETSSRLETTLFSLFAHLSYKLTDQWTLDAGLRLNRVDQSFHHQVSRPGDFSNAFNAPPAILVGENDQTEQTGTLGATYRIDDQAMTYIRFSRGFRPGGFDDTVNSVDAAFPFAEETVDAIEYGIKSEWFEDRLRLNYVAFRTSYNDKRERYAERVASGRVESVLQNLASIETRGHELEMEAIPFGSLRLRAALSRQNSDYESYLVPDLTGATAGLDLSGSIPAWSPNFMFKLSGTYQMPFRGGMLHFYGGYRFTKEYWSNPLVAAAQIDNFAMLDASVDWTYRSWTFRLFSNNLKGKRFLTNVIRPTDAELASLLATTTAARGIVTTAEVNQPEFTGIEVIYTPGSGN